MGTTHCVGTNHVCTDVGQSLAGEVILGTGRASHHDVIDLGFDYLQSEGARVLRFWPVFDLKLEFGSARCVGWQ